MNRIIKYTLTGLLAVGLASCNIDEFDDTNVNPNATTTPIPSFLLADAVAYMHNTVTATTGQHYVQYLANSQYTSDDNYQTIRFDYTGYYSGPLANLQKIISLNTDEATAEEATQYGKNANQIATAQILMQYYYLCLTDRWGDIPYSQALQLEDGVLQPQFDTQEAVYDGIFSTLETAVNNIEETDNNFDDPLFGGDLTRWKEFGNTIRMIAALRLSEVNPSKAETQFAAAYNAGVITEDVIFAHEALEAFDNPWYDRFETRLDYTIAIPLMDRMQTVANGGVLTAMIDPRLPIYADPAKSSGEYVGMPYGLTEAAAGSISNDDVSFLGSALREQTTPTFIYTVAQVKFSIAEAALRGWVSADPETTYYEAIDASMAQWNSVANEGEEIEDLDITAYEADPWVMYDGTIEQIVVQKWIASFLDGYEMWAEFRRTGYPALEPADNAETTNKEIPYRQAYTTKERDLNSDNYQEVLSRQGEDGLETKVWWDVD